MPYTYHAKWLKPLNYNEKFLEGKISYWACQVCNETTPHTRVTNRKLTKVFYECQKCGNKFHLTQTPFYRKSPPWALKGGD